ncbi:DUF1801 domain-containing protein [Hyphomonas sp.]|uniref:DUF1801 domain-containing protein n=1 Tax=Hyphomonas sp. TaxID=87 RepID=UPI003918CDCF
MAKAENKTKVTEVTPKQFIAALDDGPRKTDAEQLVKWMTGVTGLKPKMWGPSIIGFGRYHYKYESGREGEMCLVGFSPRKANTVVYVQTGYAGLDDKLARLGKHKTGQSCLYINKLADVDLDVLEEIVRDSVAAMRGKYETWDS